MRKPHGILSSSMTITCSLAQPNSWPSRAKHGLAVVLDSSRGGLASTLLESKVRTIFGRRTKIMPNQLPRVAHDEPMMVGDHPALVILNTVARVDGELVDSLPSDRDVLLWLSRVGWPPENDLAHLRADALLKSARALRATIRVLIEKRKQESGSIREPSMYSSRMPGVIWNSYRIAEKAPASPLFLVPRMSPTLPIDVLHAAATQFWRN